METVKKIWFVLIIAIMVLPAIQDKWAIVDEPDLQGDFKELQIPVFSWRGFYKSDFQSKFDPWLEQNIGFHNSLVRLTNQLDYSLYRKPNAEGIVLGKQDYIFEYDYIRQITGRDYVGMNFIDEKLRRLKYVQDYLKVKHHIDFIIVFMPGKASFFKEYIPGKYLKNKADSTNYDVYLSEIKKRAIRYINLNSFFHDFKNECKYPLFPKYGTHWSIYGMSRASEVLIDSLELFTRKKFNKYDPDSLYFSKKPLRTDYDGGNTLNLLCNLSKEEFAYPYYKFGNDPDRFKPRVLTIGDSFYWNIFNAEIPKNIFANEAFWYYNNKVYPDFYYEPVFTSDLNLKKEVESMDVIMVMVTERFLNIFDWELIDQLYYMYTPDYIKDPVYDRMNKIVLDANWFSKILREAVINNLEVGDVLYSNALNQFYVENKNDFMIRFGARSYTNYITNHEGLVRKLKHKASNENKSYDEVLFEEANYLFRMQHPKLYEIHKDIIEKEYLIKTNVQMLDSVEELASTYNCKLDDMIFYQAKLLNVQDAINKQIERIMSDENWIQHIKLKAIKEGLSFDEMLRKDAIYVVEQMGNN